MFLSQNAMYACLTSKQVHIKSDSTNAPLRRKREIPQHLGIGIAIYQSFHRSKNIIDMLHGFSMAVDYKRILRLENQIANTVITSMIQNHGIDMAHNIIPGRYMFFVIDNCDFAEDTADEKRTLHGTAMAIYQQIKSTDVHQPLNIDTTNDGKSMLPFPGFLTELLPCTVPKTSKPKIRVSTFKPSKDNIETLIPDDDLPWLVAGAMIRRCQLEYTNYYNTNDEQCSAKSTATLPTWAAYNSQISTGLPITRVAMPPPGHLAAPAHEWQTLMTVLKQAQGIHTAVVGDNRKTVITLDIGLYEPAMKLLLSHADCRNQFIMLLG